MSHSKTLMGVTIATSVTISLYFIAYVAANRQPSEGMMLLIGYSLPVWIVLWMAADAQERRKVPCYEFGFLMACTFPISMIWYPLWSRGWKGLLIIAAMAGILYLPNLSAYAAWFLLYSHR